MASSNKSSGRLGRPAVKLVSVLMLTVTLLTVAEWFLWLQPYLVSTHNTQVQRILDLHASILSHYLEGQENTSSVDSIRSLVADMYRPNSADSGTNFSSIRVEFKDQRALRSFYVGNLDCLNCSVAQVSVMDAKRQKTLAVLHYQVLPPLSQGYWIAPVAWLAQLWVALALMGLGVWRNEKALKRSEEAAIRLFDSGPTAMILVRQLDAAVVACNKSAELLLARDHTNGKPGFLSQIKESNSGGCSCEMKLQNQQGENRDYFVGRADVELDDGPHWIFSFVDITEHTELEVKHALARDKAETANRAKDAFLAAVSHEVRTPLSGVIGFADLLSKTSLDGEQSEFVQMIDIASRNMTVVIDDILDFSRIESGQLALKERPIKLPEILDEAARIVSLKAKSLRVDVSQTLADDIPMLIKTDPERLHQILTILLDNALKYAKGGNVQLATRVLQDDKLQAWIELAVVDDGPGIPKAELQNIFEPFYRLYDNDDESHGGVGLGLAIAKSLVKAMGGSIAVDSQLGLGSRFCVSLPLVEVSQQEAEQFSLDKKVGSQNLGGHTALVVDDDKINGTLLQYLLQSRGIQTYWVDAPKRAQDMLLRSRYDVVFVDLHMPGMNGVELLESVREQVVDMPPFVAISADVQADKRKMLLDKGMVDFLAKPYDDSLLSAILERYLSPKS